MDVQYNIEYMYTLGPLSPSCVRMMLALLNVYAAEHNNYPQLLLAQGYCNMTSVAYVRRQLV